MTNGSTPYGKADDKIDAVEKGLMQDRKRSIQDKYTSTGPGTGGLFTRGFARPVGSSRESPVTTTPVDDGRYTSPRASDTSGFVSSGGPSRDPPVVTAVPVDDTGPNREALLAEAEDFANIYYSESLDPSNVVATWLQDLQRRLEGLGRELDDQKREYQNERGAHEQTRNELSAERERYQEERRAHTETKRLAEERDNGLKLDLERIVQLTEELTSEREERERAEGERDELRVQYREKERNSRREIVELRASYQTLEDRAESLEREKEGLERRVEELRGRDVVARTDYDALNEGVRRLEEEASRLRGDYQNANDERNRLRIDYDRVRRENQTLERQLRALRGQARPQGDYLSGLRTDPLYDGVVAAAEANQYELALVQLGAICYDNPNSNFNGRRQAAVGLWNRVDLDQQWTFFGKKNVWGSLRGITKCYRQDVLRNKDYVKVARKLNELLDR